MSKDSRLRKAYRKSASTLHKAVGDILYEDVVFKFCKVFQEYPVNRISSYFDSGREKFDWVILDPYRAIIECHGEQHFQPVRFGGITEDEAKANYEKQIITDLKKRKAAEKAGYKYIMIRYNEEPTTQLILRRIQEHEPLFEHDEQIVSQQTPAQRRYKSIKQRSSEWLDGKREQQREYRKQQYERAKQFKRNKDENK